MPFAAPKAVGCGDIEIRRVAHKTLGQPPLDFESLSVQRFLKYASSGPENGSKKAVVLKKGSLRALDGTLGRGQDTKRVFVWFASVFAAAAFPAKYNVRVVSARVSRGILLRCKNGE